MHTVRLLPFAAASGPMNMARDEALLHSAADRGVATLRFYTWAEPTLTLGYFQPCGVSLFFTSPLEGEVDSGAERTNREGGVLKYPPPADTCGVADLPLKGGGGKPLPCVRRSTGGAAIVHDPAHEITYSLALPPGPGWQPPGESWICRMHYTIRDVLKSMGVTAKVVVCGEERKLGEVLCFLHHTPGDLVIGASVFDGSCERPGLPRPTATAGVNPAAREEAAHKIAGSAQRKWKGALLQHGSILLGRSPLAPQLPGIRELSGVSVRGMRLAAAVVERFAAVTGWRVEPGDWTAEELADADRILAVKYAAADWNEKR